jgi:hypothetical protein
MKTYSAWTRALALPKVPYRLQALLHKAANNQLAMSEKDKFTETARKISDYTYNPKKVGLYFYCHSALSET